VSTYSERWRREFGRVDPGRTARDVEFLRRVLPLPDFRRVLDVPCGEGRLVAALGEMGYDVVGADGDPAVEPALVADLRELDGLPGGFDGVVNMWASFGYFDAAENERVLGSLTRRLRPGGRLVLDLFNRAFFEGPRSETERVIKPGIVERSTLRDGRRRCEIDYGDGEVDVFEWQLYLPEELEELGGRFGLRPFVREAPPEEPSMRLVLERAASS
jgi:SAM-dependent methyltransferase